MEPYDYILIAAIIALLCKNTIFSYMTEYYISEQQNNKFMSEPSQYLNDNVETYEYFNDSTADASYVTLMSDLTASERCATYNDRNDRLIKEVQQYKNDIDKRKKMYDQLIKEQRDINTQMKLQREANLDDIKGTFHVNPYNNGDMPLSGDEMIMNKMIDVSLRNKQAINARVTWDVNDFTPHLEPELQTHEYSVWWDDETLEAEM